MRCALESLIARLAATSSQVRDTGVHTIFRVVNTQFSVPRYTEINELTARGILKHLERQFGESWWR